MPRLRRSEFAVRDGLHPWSAPPYGSLYLRKLYLRPPTVGPRAHVGGLSYPRAVAQQRPFILQHVVFLSVCTEPGCPELTSGGRCREHARERARNRQRDRQASGDPRVRGARWVRLRRSVIYHQPWCAFPGCTNPTEEVDHIVPLHRGGHPTKRSNLQGLCLQHHRQKTAEER